MALRKFRYTPHIQSYTFSSLACDALVGWHHSINFNNVQLSGGGSSSGTERIHVTGPPIAAGPYSSTYSTVLDGGVHFTYVSQDVVINPPLIILSPITPLTPGDSLATVDYVNGQTTGAMSFERPILGIYDLDAVPLPTGTVAGSRAIFYAAANPADVRNNLIYIYNGAAWIAAGSPLVSGRATAVISADEPYTYGLACISDLVPATTYPLPSIVPTVTVPVPSDKIGIRWYPVHASMNHINVPTPWPGYFFLLSSNGEEAFPPTVTHAQINSWLDQTVQTVAAPTFKGLALALSDNNKDLEVTSMNEAETQGQVSLVAPIGSGDLLQWNVPSDGTWTVTVFVAGAAAVGGGGYSSFASLNLTRSAGAISVPTLTDFIECRSGSMGAANFYTRYSRIIGGPTLLVRAYASGMADFNWRCRLSAVCST